jgi:hypothetical protein
MVIIVPYFLVLFIVIKYLFLRSSLFLSKAQSLDTPVHQGSNGDTTRNKEQMQRSSSLKIYRVKRRGAAKSEFQKWIH